MTYNEVYERYQELVRISDSAVHEARSRNIPWEKADEAMLAVKRFKAEALADGWKTYHSYARISVERVKESADTHVGVFGTYKVRQ